MGNVRQHGLWILQFDVLSELMFLKLAGNLTGTAHGMRKTASITDCYGETSILQSLWMSMKRSV